MIFADSEPKQFNLGSPLPYSLASQETLKKGIHYYLDKTHKDHIEVFNKRGGIEDVLDFTGKTLQKKLENAEKQGRTIEDLVSHGQRMPKSNFLA